MNNINNLVDKLNSSPEYSDFHNYNTITMGELVDRGYDWGKDKWYPEWASSNTHRNRINKKIEDRYYFRDIGTTPVAKWSHFMVRKLNEIIPKYKLAYNLLDRDLDPLLLWRDGLVVEYNKHNENKETNRDETTDTSENINKNQDTDYINDTTQIEDRTSVNEEQNLHGDVNLSDEKTASQLGGSDSTNTVFSGNEESATDSNEVETANSHNEKRSINNEYPQSQLNGSADYASNGNDTESFDEKTTNTDTSGTVNTVTDTTTDVTETYGKSEEVNKDVVDTNIGAYITNDDGAENTHLTKNDVSSTNTTDITDKSAVINDVMGMLEKMTSNDTTLKTSYGNMLEKWLIIIDKYADIDVLVINELEVCFSSMVGNKHLNGGW